MGSYWVPPQRLGWCRHCAALDDWKVMRAEYVDELTRAELARYVAAREENPRYPELRQGKEEGRRVYTCS
eukprot:5294816-Pyramimonas_sp.AAC.1